MKSILDIFMKVLTIAGTKAPLIWPDLEEINKRFLHILTVIGGGGAQMFAKAPGPATTPQGSKFADEVAKHGISREEAAKVAATFETLDNELTS